MCKYVNRYIECIVDQSNWSGLFSLVVVCSINNPGVLSLILSRGTQQNVLYRFFSSYFNVILSLYRGSSRYFISNIAELELSSYATHMTSLHRFSEPMPLLS